jgi:cytochrome P450
MIAPPRLPDELARIVASPKSYARWDELHEALTIVRRDFRFAKADLADYRPFWVASKLNDIREIAGRNHDCSSGLGGISTREELALLADPANRPPFRSIVQMNEPEHKKFRMLTQDWFQKKSVQQFEGAIRSLARAHVDRLAERPEPVAKARSQPWLIPSLVDREPDRHIGHGFGAHMCLGVHLARLEMSIFFEELLPRLESLELAGEPRRTVSNFVGGPKSLPVRFGLTGSLPHGRTRHAEA